MTVLTDRRSSRLANLRKLMTKAGFDGWIIGREDMYQGEEVPAGEERLAYLSGFTGSAGFAIVLGKMAGLFSDGRYSLQMEAQTNKDDWECNTIPNVNCEDWLKAAQLSDSFKIGIDGRLVSVTGFERFERAVRAAGGTLVSHSENLLDKLWLDRPQISHGSIWRIPHKSAGKTVAEKLDKLSNQLQEFDCEAILITRADSVNWLANMRGTDLPYTPIKLCFALFHRLTGLYIFGDEAALRPVLSDTVKAVPFATLPALLQTIGESGLMIEAASLPKVMYDQIIESAVKTTQTTCPVTKTKACKNDAELNGFRVAHRRDGVAMVEFLCWLDQKMEVPNSGIFESDIAKKLLTFRQQQDGFIVSSFNPIVGSGPNGAIVHYHAIAGEDRRLRANDILLLDSGAHYECGTTDITRTITIGTPPEGAATAFTHVLRAHIRLAETKFPKGTTGQQLDAIARAPLWAVEMDFAHGVGHGVGHILSVHEGPASISKRGEVVLEAGMVLSNEPGYYQSGDWGIRIENLIVVNVAIEPSFLQFETITLCPLERRLIDKTLLSRGEIGWVNSYHQIVLASLLPHLSGPAKVWLKAACRPL